MDADAEQSGEEFIAAAFKAARDEGRAALMPYMMAGFPDRDSGLAVAAAYADSGADLIELGVPFSDPLADGPTIHDAATKALDGGATLATALETCRSVADRVPVVLMVYVNMVLAHGGAAEFARLARAAGAAGAIVPDLPLVAPTTPAARRAEIGAVARGFIYLVSTLGTTGERAEVPVALADLVAATKADARGTPVAVGFGIGTAAQAAEVGRIADGVIIGSRMVRAAAEGDSPADAVAGFLAEARVGLGG